MAYDGSGTISKGGLRANFWNYVERVTGQRSLRKFVWQGLVLTLLSDLPTVWCAVLRGKAYKSVLGSIGASCFIAKNVRFCVPQRIFLEDRVFVDENACLDACHLSSKIRLGNDVWIGRGSVLRAGVGKIIVHEGTVVNRFTYLDGNGGIEVGKKSALGNHVELISADKIFDDPSAPIKGMKPGKVEIGDGVWLGSRTIVLPGVHIGDESVIGAGAVVTNDIPPYSVAFGVPARVVRKRGET